MAPTVWTKRRKWMGNLVPACFWFPLVATGLILMAKQGEVIGLGLYLLIAGSVIGWLALNRFGLFENGRMRAQLRHILDAEGASVADDAVFVGFATPRYSSALDPHEDVGFLEIRPALLRFVSETRQVEITRADVKEVRFRGNVHSLLGLGRWVSVEGQVGDRPIRLMVEPREAKSLLGNRRYARQLRERLRTWLTQ